MQAVFQEEGEEMLMTLDGPDYDSEIDGEGCLTQNEDTNTESSEEEGEIEDQEQLSANNNATVYQKGSDEVDSDDELLAEFNRLKELMEKKGIFRKGSKQAAEGDKANEKPAPCVPEGKGSEICSSKSKSESTIYQRAVKRGSSSSEDAELVNTSDEIEMGMDASGLASEGKESLDNEEIFFNLDRQRECNEERER